MTNARKRTSKVARKLTGQEPGESPAPEGSDPRPSATQRVAAVPVRPAIELTAEERSRLNLESLCSPRTIDRWAAGFPVERTTMLRLDRAMARLGIERRERTAKRRRIVDVQRVA